MSTLKAANISNLAATAVATTDKIIAGSAFAWVNFNGTGTVAIRAAYNISSITDNGTGDWTANFTASAIDANYAPSIGGAVSQSSTAANKQFNVQPHVPTTSTIRLVSTDLALGTVLDVEVVSLSLFR